MSDLLKRMKTNALLSAALYALLGLVLLLWPELSTGVRCFALGLILLLCGLGDVIEFLRHRDGSLYAALHLGVGVILAAVGLWLMSQPTLVTVVIPRIVGVLICFHGFSAGLLGLVALVLGVVLVICPFKAFTTVVRLLGAFLLYDGISDLWITGQVSKDVRQAEKDSNAKRDAVDVEYRDVKDE